MRYIKLSTLEYPRHQGDIRLEYPNMGDEFVCPDTYALVNVEPIPDYDPDTSVFEFQDPYERDGQWFQNAIIRLLTQEEIENRNKMFALLNLNQAKGTEPDVIG
jgi:hypothetical protein